MLNLTDKEVARIVSKQREIANFADVEYECYFEHITCSDFWARYLPELIDSKGGEAGA